MRLREIISAMGIAVAGLVACDNTTTPLTNIYISAERTKIVPGDTTQLCVRPYPHNADAGFPTEEVVWFTSDSTIGVVGDDGIFKARKFGDVTISVTYGRFSAKRELVVSDTIHIEDEHLREFLMQSFDTNFDGILEGYETSHYTDLDFTGLHLLTSESVNFDGLEVFVNLRRLTMSRITVGMVPFGKLEKLEHLDIKDCELDTLDLREVPSIATVYCFGCPSLKAILFGDMGTYGPNELKTLDCHRCDISELDLSRSAGSLWDVDVSGNPRLGALDLSTDTMMHTCKYSCDVTAVSLPAIPEDATLYVECK